MPPKIVVPTVRTLPSQRDALTAHVLTQLRARQRIAETGLRFSVDIVDWAQDVFYIPATAKPIVALPHQVAVWRYMFTRREDHRFPVQTFVYSTVKQSGKSTFGGVAARYMAETQTRYGEVFAVGNDRDQAKDRSFREVRYSIELSPGFNKQRDTLIGRWRLQKLSMECLLTGTSIKAIAVDAKGEAGGKPALTVWTELWGFEHQDARRFWDELTPVPTVPDSHRLVETYAGYDGESELLHSLYDKGRAGRQLTAGELAAFACREDVPGQTFEDLVNGWAECKGDPTAKVPVWINEADGILLYWDDGYEARRMPWQQGEAGDRYYREQQGTLPGPAYRRFHLNEWVGAESQFVPMESWDACGAVHDIPPIEPGDKVPLVIGLDAATTGDCFGVIAVCRCPHDRTAVDVRGFMVWNPKDEVGGVVNYDEPEAWLIAVNEINNIVQAAYDPYQLENMMQRRRRGEGGVKAIWCEPFPQNQERLKADRGLYDLIIQRRIHHNGKHNELRQHIANANAKVQKDEDSKMRIVKKPSGRKIDLAVALSMAAARCLYLNLA